MVFIPAEFLPEYRPSRKFSPLSSDGWWLNRWPLLGWLETFVKVAAWCFVPYIPVPAAEPVPFETIPKPFAIETLIMLIASVLLAAAIIDRLVYREIISMIFVFPTNWAHWTVAMAMYRGGRHGVNVRYFRIFCWLMLAGDVVKLLFFAVHDFSRLNISRYFLYLLVAFFAASYALVLLIDYGYFDSHLLKIYNSLPIASLFSFRRR